MRSHAPARNDSDPGQARRSRDIVATKAKEKGISDAMGLAKTLEYVGKQNNPEEVAQWRHQFQRLHEMSVEDLEQFSAAAARWAARAACAAQAHAGRQCAKWVSNAWKAAQGWSTSRSRARGQ